jgi:RimJ/RimL family protein N-acetyltransferase
MLPGLSAPEGYCFLPDDPPADLAELTGRYERQARGRSDDGTERWYNWVIRDGGSCAALGYTQATIQARSALNAYQVFPACWRSGVGYRALSETLDMLFSRLGADRAWALVDTRNVASLGHLAKLGFAIVARHDGAGFFKGEPSHELELEIRRMTWRGASQ